MPVTTVFIIASIVSAGASVGGAAENARQTRLRREYESNLALLSDSDKKALEKKLREEQNIDAKKIILAETLSNAAVARITAVAQTQAQKQKAIDTLLIIGGLAIVLLIVGKILK